MAYQIVLLSSAEKELDKLPLKSRILVFSGIEGLAENPYEGKKLKGELQDCYSLRIWPYRVIYGIKKKERVVIIIRIGQRGSVYI